MKYCSLKYCSFPWFPPGFLLVFPGFLLVSPWFPPGISDLCERFGDGFLLVSPWFPPGFLLVSPCSPPSFPLGYLICVGGLLIVSSWFPPGFPIVSLWFPHSLPWFTFSFFLVSPWFPPGFPKVSPWVPRFHPGFLLVSLWDISDLCERFTYGFFNFKNTIGLALLQHYSLETYKISFQENNSKPKVKCEFIAYIYFK